MEKNTGLCIQSYSLNPYSTGNEVVGSAVEADRVSAIAVLILILLEMRLLDMVHRTKPISLESS